MGKITGNFESENRGQVDLLLGDNEFETGVLTLAASGSVKEGALLKRESNGNFGVVTDTSNQTPVAVYVGEDITNSSESSATYPTRAVISGRVAASRCHYSTNTALSAADKDALRGHSIIALDAYESGR